MANRLLDRQTRLLDYLSSGAAIFGQQSDAPADPYLKGIDPGVLRLQARFACNKRIERIIAVFPRTFEIFGAEQRIILREFVEASRPTSKSTLANAREFHAFLSTHWRGEPPEPPHLPDVAACELAMVEARNLLDDDERPGERGESDGPRRGIRRRGSVVPLRCAHDIRSIFDPDLGEVVPPKREISLVVTVPAGLRDIKIVEVAPVVLDALALLDDWTDPRTLDAFEHRDDLVEHLATHDLIEVRP